MTWVLILKPAETGGWPAVIGGYAARWQAEAAGREAVMRDLEEQIGGRGIYEPEVQAIAPYSHPFWRRPWINYTVIPGVAAGAPTAPEPADA